MQTGRGNEKNNRLWWLQHVVLCLVLQCLCTALFFSAGESEFLISFSYIAMFSTVCGFTVTHWCCQWEVVRQVALSLYADTDIKIKKCKQKKTLHEKVHAKLNGAAQKAVLLGDRFLYLLLNTSKIWHVTHWLISEGQYKTKMETNSILQINMTHSSSAVTISCLNNRLN